MGLLPRTYQSRQTPIAEQDTTWAPSGGAYLTDGAALFCVGHVLSDRANGELFLELENCDSGDVILCPSGAVSALGLRSVTPAAAL